MKVCVAGGAGFIGSNFINYMINKYRDIQIVCLDALTYAGNLENLESVKENTNFKFYRGNILDNDFLDDVFSKESFDLVLNFAAETYNHKSIKDSNMFLKTNIIGTKNLMDMCLKYNVVRFHQISIDEVNDKFFCEHVKNPSSSIYSLTKASSDMLALCYYKNFNLGVTISRSSNNYGPYQYPENLIPSIVVKAIKNEKICINKNNKPMKLIHVYDHVIAIDKIIRNGKVGNVYNIFSREEIDELTLTKKILNVLNKDESLIVFKNNENINDDQIHNNDLNVKDDLCFECKIKIFEGLEYTVNWYLNNFNWIEMVLKDKYIEV